MVIIKEINQTPLLLKWNVQGYEVHVEQSLRYKWVNMSSPFRPHQAKTCYRTCANSDHPAQAQCIIRAFLSIYTLVCRIGTLLYFIKCLVSVRLTETFVVTLKTKANISFRRDRFRRRVATIPELQSTRDLDLAYLD